MSNLRYEFTASEEDLFRPKLLYITQSVYGADWHSTPHFHPFTEILFVTKGSGTFYIDRHRCDIRRGNLVIISPNHIHTEQSNDKSAMEYFIIGVDNLLFDIMKEEFDEDKIFFPVFDFSNHYDKAVYYLETMFTEIQQRRINYKLIVESILAVFIIYVMRHTNLAVMTTPPPSHESRLATKECIFIKQYIDSHFAYKLNLDELCGKVFISKYYLIHSFKEAYGSSPIQYLLRRRIDEAKTLLRTTDLSVSTIAQTVGFSSPSHFTKKFTEELGISPFIYRKSDEQ